MSRLLVLSGFLVLATSTAVAAFAQNQLPQATSGNANLTTDYPTRPPGIFIKAQLWQQIHNQVPAKIKGARVFAAAFSYGLVPAKVVAEYEREHSATAVDTAQPILCICHMFSLPGEPVIVRLHPKKGARELDGGKFIVYPLVGGGKISDASKSDLIPVDQSHPDDTVWLVRPQSPLAPGEYALMLGTQNVNIYPFTVTAPANNVSGEK